MQYDSINAKWPNLRHSAHSTWQRAGGVNGSDSGHHDTTPLLHAGSSVAHTHRGLTPKVMGGLMIVFAILALTYGAAATLASGAASHTNARPQHLTALQQASAEYRRARAECLRLVVAARDGCIADAHAAEDRARAVAALSPPSFLVSLRSRTDAAIDAADRDGIVIEPACSVVSRGQAGVCEIQINSGNALAQAKPEQPADPARVEIKTGDAPIVKARAQALPGANGLLQLRTDADTRRHDAYLFSVAAVTR